MPLYISHDADLDWLIALEFGRVFDGQPDDHRRKLSEQFTWILDGPDGDVLGFVVDDFSEFDADAPEHEAIWSGQTFEAPTLGLTDSCSGEILVAARATLGGQSSINRMYFDDAVRSSGREAAGLWLACLEAGDCMAHFGLGYTLVELGELKLAYRHLRAYAELVSWNAWAWCWLGRACEEMGETVEAVAAYERACDLQEEGGFETDAPRLLDGLRAGTPLSAATRVEDRTDEDDAAA